VVTSGGKLTVKFDFLYDGELATANSSQAFFVVLSSQTLFGPENGPYVAFAARNGKLVIIQRSGSGTTITEEIALGSNKRVPVTFSLNNDKATLQIEADRIETPAFSPFPSPELRLFVGEALLGTNAPLSVHFDNLTISQ
jgi:hypothetical protein